MKLYATTTSERATKGQGGKFLIIEVFDEDKKKLLNLHIYEGENGMIMRGSNYGITKIEINEAKGEKQKDEYNPLGLSKASRDAWKAGGEAWQEHMRGIK